MKRTFLQMQEFNRGPDDFRLIGTPKVRAAMAELINIYLQQLYLNAPTWRDLSHSEIEQAMSAFENCAGADIPAMDMACQVLTDLFGLEGEEREAAYQKFRHPNLNYFSKN